MTTQSVFQEYVYISRYARFIHEERRRERWPETVTRYFDFFKAHLKSVCGYTLDDETRKYLEHSVLNYKVMPSMRCIMTAGPALERENVAGYNCQYISIDCPKSFSEMLYLLMNGCGVGFSIERQNVNKLPDVPDELWPTDTVIVVADSKIGWAKSLNELISLLYTGNIPQFDLSKVRPAGSILKVFGGRASGPAPLNKLFEFVIDKFKQNKGQKLTSIDCHDICCMIGSCVVSGGVRRSALISLSNLSDDRMRSAKVGQWWVTTPYRSIANNSAVYTDRCPPMDTFINEWKSLYDSKSGERGIFSRWASRNIVAHSNEFRKKHFGDSCRLRDLDHAWGCNPCSEIILRNNQGCNLSEAVVRSYDTLETLKEKVKVAAILGTFQSTLTNFKFLSKAWKRNFEDERLLGVSLTGIMDNPILSGAEGDSELIDVLITLRKVVIQTNMEWAAKLGIPQSTATTCIKPSGTVSALNDTASGIHSRHASYYLRSARNDKKDPVAQLLIDQGFYHEDDVMRPNDNYVFYFPTKAPDGALVRKDVDAIKQLEMWKLYQVYWTEHKPSITVSVGEDEWMKVGSWVYDNFEWMSGVSFLPLSDHSYQQAPFQDISETEYQDWLKKTPPAVDWTKLQDYEALDMTTGSQELACSSGACELM